MGVAECGVVAADDDCVDDRNTVTLGVGDDTAIDTVGVSDRDAPGALGDGVMERTLAVMVRGLRVTECRNVTVCEDGPNVVDLVNVFDPWERLIVGPPPPPTTTTSE